MISWKAMSVLLWMLLCMEGINASRILFFVPLGSKSHYHFYGEVARVLLEHEHEITYYTAHRLKEHKNLTQIESNVYIENLLPNKFNMSFIDMNINMMTVIPNMCVDVMNNEDIRGLKMEDYDLVFVSAFFFSDCLYSYVEGGKVPFIVLSPNKLLAVQHGIIGNVEFASFVPTMGTHFAHPMAFHQRLINALSSALMHYVSVLVIMPQVLRVCIDKGPCRPDAPPLYDVARNASLMFVNSVQSLEVPSRPYVPTVIHAGALNCRPAQPLSKELKEFIEGAGDAGVIYFSLGSAVKASEMPEGYRRVLIRVFGSLPQRVLWKWDAPSVEGLPSNVMLSPWLPQQDVLGHPNVKLFITHGGLFSTYETIYHAKPVLGMPVFADQDTNVAIAVSDGYAEAVQWTELNEDVLKEKIELLLTDRKYKEAVRRLSVLMRDQPMPVEERVLYWTEYVIRHGGAPHLRSPVHDLTWYQLYNLDVWLTISCTALLVLSLSLRVTLSCTRCLWRRLSSQGSKLKQN